MTYQSCNCDVLQVKGIGYNHFAILYKHDVSMPMVYEAWPPEVQWSWLEDWQKRWDRRIYKWTGAKLIVYRATEHLTPSMQIQMRHVAVDRLGTPYGWIENYWRKLQGVDHCVEYLVRQMMVVDLVFPREPSRIIPNILLEVMLTSRLWEKDLFDYEVVTGERTCDCRRGR
jgi:hypothetical protein